MSLHYYSENEDNFKEESIDKYKNIFIEYEDNFPNLPEALKQMFISEGCDEKESNELINDIIIKTEKIINKNKAKIKLKYPKIKENDMKIISSYTCEAKNKKYSPYKLLNKNLVSDNRQEGINNISKYLYILINSLRKLDKYYPKENSKYLYRCINTKVEINNNIFKPKLIPYMMGNKKTFWSFTSTSPDVMTTYNFLKNEEKNKSGTIFTLTGKVWGYDITLFNYYGENEIILEPERKFIVDEVLPPVNDIIHIKSDIQDTPLILLNIPKKNQDIEILKYETNNFDLCYKYIIIGDAGVGKQDITNKFINKKEDIMNQGYIATVRFEFLIINMKIKNKIIKLQLWDTSGQERYKCITSIYCRNSSCAIIVYDITNRQSFEHIELWVQECRNYSPPDIVFVFVGNKSKLEEERKVNYDEGKSLADKYNGLFYEISGENDKNIDNIFIDSAYILFKGYENCGNNFLENDKKVVKLKNLDNGDYKRNKERCC